MQWTSAQDYLVELFREPAGELLIQQRLESLGHLADEARYEAVSRGVFPDEPEQMTATLSPLPDGDGPFLRGVRLLLGHRRRPELNFTLEFPKEIASSLGTELAAQLIAQEQLKKDESFRVRLAAGPRAPQRRLDLLALADAEVHEAPLPVTRQSLADFGVTADALAAANEERPVFFAQPIVNDALSDAVRNGNQEVGTLLLGQLIEDRTLLDAGKRTSWAVVITEQMTVPEGRGTAASFTFPPEALRRARRLAELRGRNEIVLGSQHSHGWRCHECGEKRCEIRNLFFSADDVRMAELFPVFAAFLVVGGDPERDRDRPVPNLYLRRRGTMQATPFATFG